MKAGFVDRELLVKKFVDDVKVFFKNVEAFQNEVFSSLVKKRHCVNFRCHAADILEEVKDDIRIAKLSEKEVEKFPFLCLPLREWIHVCNIRAKEARTTIEVFLFPALLREICEPR